MINTAGTTEWTKFVKEIENVALARRNTHHVPMDLATMGSQDRKFQGNCSWCGILLPHGERLSKENRVFAKQTKRVDGLARTIKAKASLARARAKASLARGKARARTKER